MKDLLKKAMIKSRRSRVVLLPAKYALWEAVQAFEAVRDDPEFKGDNFYIGLIRDVVGVRFLGNDFEIDKSRRPSQVSTTRIHIGKIHLYMEGLRDIDMLSLSTGIPIFALLKIFTMLPGDEIILSAAEHPLFDVRKIERLMPQIQNRRHRYEHHDIFRKVRVTRIK